MIAAATGIVVPEQEYLAGGEILRITATWECDSSGDARRAIAWGIAGDLHRLYVQNTSGGSYAAYIRDPYGADVLEGAASSVSGSDREEITLAQSLSTYGERPIPIASDLYVDIQAASGDIGTIVLDVIPKTARQIVYRSVPWTSDASGDKTVWLDGTEEEQIRGVINRMITVPSVDAPSANYDVTLLTMHGDDVLQGLGADRSDAVVEAAPIYAQASSGHWRSVLVDEATRLVIANAGAAKSGNVVFVVDESFASPLRGA